jgi:hypothetical protein
MTKSGTVKAIVMSFLSILAGLLIHFNQMKERALGKDEFLKRESIRYDRFLLHPGIEIIIAALFMGVAFFGLYELICYFIFKIIDKKESSSL